MSRMLVTGGAGFIGSHVVQALLRAGHEVAVVDDLSSGKRENLPPQAAFYELDIRSERLDFVFGEVRPEVVFHHAAQIDVRLSVARPAADADVNVLGSLNVLEGCRRAGVRKVVYMSTGGALYGEPRYLPADEGHPIRPVSGYGISKYTVEFYLHLYEQLYGLRHTTLRAANVYGPRQDPHGEAGVVAIFSGLMLRGEQPTIFGDGSMERDYVYVDDVVAANLAALERGDGEAYNIGTGRGTSVGELFATMKELSGYEGEPRYAPPRPGEVSKMRLDVSKAAAELGWEPHVPLREGLQRVLDYFRATLEPPGV